MNATETRPTDLLATRQLAGQAMQALIAHQGIPKSESTREEYALWAYRMAQMMLATEKRLHLGDSP